MPIFDQGHLKIIEITFSFPEFDPAYKISSFHQCILEIQSISVFCDKTGHTHLWPHPTKNILITFQFMWIRINMQKFIDLFWRYGWLENPEIWLAENIFAHMSGNKVFPSMGFMQEQSKCNKCYYRTNSVKNFQ